MEGERSIVMAVSLRNITGKTAYWVYSLTVLADRYRQSAVTVNDEGQYWQRDRVTTMTSHQDRNDDTHEVDGYNNPRIYV